MDANLGWNCGIEGPTESLTIRSKVCFWNASSVVFPRNDAEVYKAERLNAELG